MTCDDARRHWGLYHDSEGTAELHMRIGEHLAECPSCTEWFHQESRLEHLIAERLRTGPETSELWDRILAGSGLAKQPEPSRRWMMFLGVAACAASIVVAAWLGLGSRIPPGPGEDLAELTASWHARLVDGREPVPFLSRSDREVERYLRQRVSFPVRCPPRRDAGFAVRGSGVCDLAEQSAAFLVGDVGDAPVSIFVLPSESLDAFPHQREAIRREGTHHCREGDYLMAVTVIDRNVVLVVGRVDEDQLLRVLRAYGTYPEPDTHTGESRRGRGGGGPDASVVLAVPGRNHRSHS